MHLNEWMTASSAWMNMAAWGKCYDPELTHELVKDFHCWLGGDLASKLDLAATLLLYKNEIDGRPHYYCMAPHCYLPEERINAPENQQYQLWEKQGFLTATTGSSNRLFDAGS